MAQDTKTKNIEDSRPLNPNEPHAAIEEFLT